MLDKVSTDIPAQMAVATNVQARTARAQFHARLDEDLKAYARFLQTPPDFLKDMFNYFTRKESGHLTPYLYKDKNALSWQTSGPIPESYYIYHADGHILTDHPGYFSDLADRIRIADKPLIAIELGGTGEAASIKTIPFLKETGAGLYVNASNSMEANAAVSAKVEEAMPELKRKILYTPDFNSAAMDIPDIGGRRIMFQFGSSLGNMSGGFNDELPAGEVYQALLNYRKHLDGGDILVLGIDQNQDEESIINCYSDPLHGHLAMGVLANAVEVLPVEGFVPEYYRPEQTWSAKNHLYAHCYRTLRTNTFTMPGITITSQENDLRNWGNSYKFPQNFMNSLYPYANFRLLDILPDRQKRVHLQVLQAV